MTATDPTRRALAHPVRLRMMNLTRTTPMSGAELARELGISYALAARHLQRLADVGLVAPLGEGRYRAVGSVPPSGPPPDGGPLTKVLALTLRERAAGRVPERGGMACDVGLSMAPDAWDDFRYRLAALLVTLHDAARAPRPPVPRPAPEAEQVGARVMAFPIVR